MRKLVFAAALAAVGNVALAATDVMMFFDTEDYTNPWSDDSVLEIANLLKEEGVVGNFDVVGFWAQKIIENRRFDVLDSLKGHTIGTQSLYHSLHPTECEWAGREDAREAYRLVHEHEAMCVGMLRAAFGLDKILYMTEPGNSGTYIANTVGYDLGMKVGYGMLPSATYGMWYDNLFQLPYDWSLESMFPPNPEPDYRKLLDDWAKRPFMCLAMHPDKVRSTTHWDIVNYREKNLAAWRQWKAAPRRSETDVQEFYRRLRNLCRALKSDSRFNVTDVHACIAKLKPRRALTPSDLPAIEAALRKELWPVSAPGSYCVADVFQAAARFLLGEKSFLPAKAYGFLSQPVGVTAATTVRADDLRAAAAKLDFSWYLPASIDVGGQAIGPADFLFAALEVLRTGAATVTVSPREQLGSFDRLPRWKDFEYVRGWIIHSRDLADKILSDRLRWQLWTLRYEEGFASAPHCAGLNFPLAFHVCCVVQF